MSKTPPSDERMESLFRRLAEALSEAEKKAGGASAESRSGLSLKPGTETPLWNVLREQAQVRLKGHGEQAKLARRLGLHRQAVNAYFTQRTRLPDGERALQILLWLLEREDEAGGKETRLS